MVGTQTQAKVILAPKKNGKLCRFNFNEFYAEVGLGGIMHKGRRHT